MHVLYIYMPRVYVAFILDMIIIFNNIINNSHLPAWYFLSDQDGKQGIYNCWPYGHHYCTLWVGLSLKTPLQGTYIASACFKDGANNLKSISTLLHRVSLHETRWAHCGIALYNILKCVCWWNVPLPP